MSGITKITKITVETVEDDGRVIVVETVGELSADTKMHVEAIYQQQRARRFDPYSAATADDLGAFFGDTLQSYELVITGSVTPGKDGPAILMTVRDPLPEGEFELPPMPACTDPKCQHAQALHAHAASAAVAGEGQQRGEG